MRHLGLSWFGMTMGLAGLALAWLRAEPRMGAAAGAVGAVIAALAAVLFLALGALTAWRAHRHPQALAEELRHPVRQAFVASATVSLVLLATLLATLGGPSSLANALWMAGSAAQFLVTTWVLGRWLRGGLTWAAVTPALIVPVIGNVVPPLAGVALGFPAWSAAQFGIGLLFWPVIVGLLAARLIAHGPWPDRLLPTTFVAVAPPAVIGMAALSLGAPVVLAWMCWGLALFFLAWGATVLRRMLAQAFSMTYWALSFPLAAFASLSLRLAEGATPAFAPVALASLALATLVIGALGLATVQGLRRGSLLAPEPVATLAQAPAPAAVPRSV